MGGGLIIFLSPFMVDANLKASYVLTIAPLMLNSESVVFSSAPGFENGVSVFLADFSKISISCLGERSG